MTRRKQALVLSLAAVVFILSLVVFPIQPFDSEIMAALEQTGATVENWNAQGLELWTRSGEPITLADYRGRLLYLTFWAEWCSVCKDEMPTIDAFARLNGHRVEVLMACVDDDPAASLEYLRERYPEGAHFGILVDPGGQAAARFGATGVPETFIIDGDGTVIARFLGPHDFLSRGHQQLLNHLLASR